MRIRDAIIWATILDENPLPAGCPSEPRRWAAWSMRADSDARMELYGAAVPLLAERWADAMEAEMSYDPHRGVAHVAASTLLPVIASAGAFGVTPLQYGCIVAMLSAAWVYGDDLARWHRHQLLTAAQIGLAS